VYMEKLAVGPAGRGVCSLEMSVEENIEALASAKGERIDDLTVVVLDRPRHAELIERIRATGARIKLISDGDLSAGIAAAVAGSGIHAVMGIGGAPEGVLTAAAMRCLNGEIFARLVVQTPEHEARCRAMGITDIKRLYTATDLASADSLVFAATGVTDGDLLKGVRFFGDGMRTSSVVMESNPQRIRFIDTIHLHPNRDFKVRF
jgi:fructose-1,6-bisphosphatase II / sedoheptulose-1,7-bisphosphatase